MKITRKRFATAIFALSVLPLQTWSLASTTDPIRSELDAAKRAFYATVYSATNTLLGVIDTEMKSSLSRGAFDYYQELRGLKNQLATTGKLRLPNSHPLRKHQVAFDGEGTKAVIHFAEALAIGAKKYTLKQEFDKATEVRLELKGSLKAFDNRLTGLIVGKFNRGRIIEYLTIAIRVDPKNTGRYYSRGLAYSENNDHDNAIKDLSLALRMDPTYAPAYTLRGHQYKSKGQYDKAIEDYSNAIKGFANYHQGYLYRGLVYALKSEASKAVKDFTEAILLKPNYAPAYYYRGQAYKRSGRTAAAEADFLKADQLKAQARRRR